MNSIRYTRNLFLRAICVVYLFAFISFYVQIRGLFGNNGILPAQSFLENSQKKSLWQTVHYRPTLLWLAPYLGLDTGYALEVLALLGSFLAFTGFVSQKICTLPLFPALWSLYFSIYLVGQTFVESQWDNLLLEAGFLAIFVAPLLPGRKRGSKGSPKDDISFWLVRWLLFRFMFSIGVAKLLSGSTMWWDLSAKSFYFESTVIPTPLSWYFHHIPQWVLKLFTAFTLSYELLLPFLYFVPIRSVRITAFTVQIMCQIVSVLTGNHNFVNLLIVSLCVSLLDDKFFFAHKKTNSKIWDILGILANIAIHAAFIYAFILLFNLKVDGNTITSKMTYTKSQFESIIGQCLIRTTYFGILSLGLRVARSISATILEVNGALNKFYSFLGTAVISIIAVLLFLSSTVPLHSLHKSTNSSINTSLRTAYNRLSKLHIVNQHGVFHKFGTTGRPEIILEGSNNVEGPWVEYNFLYKPGNVNHSLPYVAPYSPRLDWQFWFATQTTYQEQPWLLSLTHRLLLGQPEVLALIDRNQPFAQKPPKFIRASLYNYKFTPWTQKSQSAWWKREKVREYFPAFSADSPALVDYLKARNLLPAQTKEVNPVWKQVLDNIRYVTSHLEATLLLWSVFTAGFAIITTTSR